MYKIGEYIVYNKEVCLIKDIKTKYINDIDYYILSPLDDKSLNIKIPVNNEFIRKIINKKEALNLIEEIPTIEIIEINDKNIESIYKQYINSSDLRDLVKIIKTTYLRNEDRLKSKRKIGEIDDQYFKKAEKLLYDELSISLDKTFDETKEFVLKKVEELIK